jgi:hypothetical protein
MKATVFTAFGGFCAGGGDEQLTENIIMKASTQINSRRIDRPIY